MHTIFIGIAHFIAVLFPISGALSFASHAVSQHVILFCNKTPCEALRKKEKMNLQRKMYTHFPISEAAQSILCKEDVAGAHQKNWNLHNSHAFASTRLMFA